jgi:hypothetical protein
VIFKFKKYIPIIDQGSEEAKTSPISSSTIKGNDLMA